MIPGVERVIPGSPDTEDTYKERERAREASPSISDKKNAVGSPPPLGPQPLTRSPAPCPQLSHT